MEDEFIYTYQNLPVGIRVEEVTGSGSRSARVWELMAKQIYCESGRDGYRAIEHYDSGAPYLYDDTMRISISHTDHFLVVASLQRTPECDLSVFSLRSALGIDAEREDRKQVLGVRDRFLSPEELDMVVSDDQTANILAWTAKEALLKCAMRRDIDIRDEIRITKMPVPDVETGMARVRPVKDGEWTDLVLYSYRRDGIIITVAYSPKSATLKKRKK